MSDIKLVIKMPKESYEQIIEAGDLDYLEVITAIENGILLPEGHGRLIDASEYFKKEFGDAREFLDKSTTIIEADKEQ